LGRRESEIAEGWGRLVELDQLFIHMQILDHRTHLDVERPYCSFCHRLLMVTGWFACRERELIFY
jgi:hypothetical protein